MAGLLDSQPGLLERISGLLSPSESAGPDLTEAMRSRFGMPPASLRMFAETLSGDRSKITEQSFTPEELDILRQAGETALAQGRTNFGYGDYAPGGEKSFTDYGGNSSVLHALTDLPSSLSFTLGMANVGRNPDGGMTIRDKYDFSASKQQVDELKSRGLLAILGVLGRGYANNGLLGIGNVLGNLATPENAGRDVEINFRR